MWAHGVTLLADALYALLALVLVAMCLVAFALSRKVYRRALITHAMRLNMASRTLAGVAKLFTSSMNAEEEVEQLLRSVGWTDVYLRRRVPVARVGHNREVDLIAVGPVILVIEVKHWRGRVWCNGSRWFQQPDRRNNYTLEFEDVLEDNVVKAAALRRQLENTHRIALPDSGVVYDDTTMHADAAARGADVQLTPTESGESRHARAGTTGTWYSDDVLHKQCGYSVVPVVVFTNPAVVLDPATVRAKRHVFTMQTFRAFAAAVARDGMAAYGDLANCGGRRAPTREGRDGQDGAAGVRHSAQSWLYDAAAWLVRPMRSPCVLFWPRAATAAAPRPASHEAAAAVEESRVLARPDSSLRAGNITLSRQTRTQVSRVVDMMRTWDAVYMHNGRLLTGDVQRVEAPSAGCEYERKHLLEVIIRWNVGVWGYVQTLLYNKAGTVELRLVSSKRAEFMSKLRKRGSAPSSPTRGHSSAGIVMFDIMQRRKRVAQTDRLLIKLAGTQKLTTVPLIDIQSISLSRHLYAKERELEG